MVYDQCPIHAEDRALELAGQLEVGEIPLDFEPGDPQWKEILAMIARRFSNHARLQDQLDDLLANARLESCENCEFLRANPGGDYVACQEHWLAEYRLWEAALDASERAYQRWLAKSALRNAAEQDT